MNPISPKEPDPNKSDPNHWRWEVTVSVDGRKPCLYDRYITKATADLVAEQLNQRKGLVAEAKERMKEVIFNG